MKLKDFIDYLLDWEQEYGGDLEVVLSTDTEGNYYSTTHKRCFGLTFENEIEIIAAALANKKMPKGRAKEIGLVIYPYAEGFFSAEEAVKASKERI